MYEYLFKANPYHDAAGRFTTGSSATFVSVGGVFSRSNARARTVFQEARAERKRVQAEKAARAAAAAATAVAPVRLSREARAAARTERATAREAREAARVARATAVKIREARKTDLQEQRTSLVQRTLDLGPSAVATVARRLRGRRDGYSQRRHQEIINDPNTTEANRDYFRGQLALIEHATLLADAGLTADSTLATAMRIPTVMLEPGNGSMTFREAAIATEASSRVRREARLDARAVEVYNMTPEDARAALSEMSYGRRSNLNRRATNHALAESRRLTDLSFLERQAELDAMPPYVRNRLDRAMGDYERREWDRQRLDYERDVIGHTTEALAGMGSKEYARVRAGLSDEARGFADSSRGRGINAVIDSVRTLSASNRAVVLGNLPSSVRANVEAAVPAEMRTRWEAEAKQERAAEARAAATAEVRRRESIRERSLLNPTEQLAFDGAVSNTNAGVVSNNSSGESAVRFAAHYPGVTAADITRAMLGDSPTISDVSVSITPSGDVNFSGGHGTTMHGAALSSLQRNFSNSTKTVSHGYLKLPASAQGGGATKKLFAASIPLYQKMGMKKVTVYAALDGGGYAWARYGFDSPDGSFARAARSRLPELQGSLESRMTPEARKEYAALELVMSQHATNPSLTRLITTTSTPHLDRVLVASGLGTRGRQSTFISHALRGSAWSGEFDLSNEEQMRHLSKYVGVELSTANTRGVNPSSDTRLVTTRV